MKTKKKTIRDIDEFRLIEMIIRKTVSRNSAKEIVVDNGDDAAVIRSDTGYLLVSSIDQMNERVHFDLRYTDFFSLGWKALISNVSDLLAMNSDPRWATLALALPDKIAVSDVTEFCRGLRKCGSAHGVKIVGGNVSRSESRLSVTVAINGQVRPRDVITRSGAKEGDVIVVLGRLGGSKAGLRVLQEDLDRKKFAVSVRAHLRPSVPFEDIAMLRSKRIQIHSGIDLSDGLVGDLEHICRQSKVGAELHLSKLPVSSSAKKVAQKLKENYFDYALYGGEDYSLLLTLSENEYAKTQRIHGLKLVKIGSIKKGNRIELINSLGEVSAPKQKSFKHF